MNKVIDVFKKIVICGHPNALFENIMSFLGDKNGFFGYIVQNKVVITLRHKQFQNFSDYTG